MGFWGLRKGYKKRRSDTLFSWLVRRKRGNRCEKCGRKHDWSSQNIGVSHFWPRSHETSRYDERNVDVLCNLPCHDYYENHREEYIKFKQEKMGINEYNVLMFHAHQTGRWDSFTEKKLCEEFNKELKKYPKNVEV